jgi:hypothetical protein
MKDKPSNLDESAFNLLTNASIYIQIQSLESKVTELFGLIAQSLGPTIDSFNRTVGEDFQSKNPKISRGNNYKGLPWTTLDYPRNFDTSGVFAFRLLCLRGHSFVITMHISGKFYQKYKIPIFKNLPFFECNNYLITNGDSEWEHLITSENYKAIPSTENEIKEIENKTELIQYIKFAKAISFYEWDNLTTIIQAEYNFLLKTLN